MCTEPCDSGVYGPQWQGGVQSPLAENAVKSIDRFFFEKLKGNASVEMVKQKLPPWIKSVDFDSEFQWLLFGTMVGQSDTLGNLPYWANSSGEHSCEM